MNVNAVDATKAYKPQKKVAKAVVGTVATAAAATGAALYLAKTGKLDKFVGKNAKVDTAVNGLKDVADKVTAKLTETYAKVEQTEVFKKATGKAKVAGEYVADKFNKVADFVKARLGKFNPDLAPEAEKMAETFNNFAK